MRQDDGLSGTLILSALYASIWHKRTVHLGLEPMTEPVWMITIHIHIMFAIVLVRDRKTHTSYYTILYNCHPTIVGVGNWCNQYASDLSQDRFGGESNGSSSVSNSIYLFFPSSQLSLMYRNTDLKQLNNLVSCTVQTCSYTSCLTDRDLFSEYRYDRYNYYLIIIINNYLIIILRLWEMQMQIPYWTNPCIQEATQLSTGRCWYWASL